MPLQKQYLFVLKTKIIFREVVIYYRFYLFLITLMILLIDEILILIPKNRIFAVNIKNIDRSFKWYLAVGSFFKLSFNLDQLDCITSYIINNELTILYRTQNKIFLIKNPKYFRNCQQHHWLQSIIVAFQPFLLSNIHKVNPFACWTLTCQKVAFCALLNNRNNFRNKSYVINIDTDLIWSVISVPQKFNRSWIWSFCAYNS